ncbi:X-Pro dipeptidyl-peptidase protein [Myriangium duriaei CBS 260.36]|uniref:X-Pro dipeptidyl-peptidase protein n=1 Tax=Myriangium duriaei CBS 260.36 TaxID=1168546 RepID=A0A9P4JDT5_9PEZI|nr:X-Pro dipeptidyl-peptidase protein [Myriangium duriaei CBS 260.36]
MLALPAYENILALTSIPKGSIKLAGLVHHPTQRSSGQSSAIVVVHPGGGVKEQTANTYAKKLSERGYVTICFDASHQGASEGLPRLLEDPAARITDISASVDYLQRLDNVDADCIGAVGICGGGGYAVAAAKVDHRIKVVAIVSAVNFGDVVRLGWYGDEDPVKQIAALDQAARAVTAETQGGTPAITPYVSPEPDEKTPNDLKDAHNYYLTSRAQHPNAQNKMLVRSIPLILGFDAWQFADVFLTQPTLIIMGEKAESRWHSEKLYDLLKDKNKHCKKVLVPGGRHMDFYDNDKFISPAIQDIVTFFKQNGL